MLHALPESFLRDLDDLLARPGDPKTMVDAAAESLRRLLGGWFFIDEEVARTRPDEVVRHELHRDPGGRFLLLACSWAPGQSTPVHDHGSWGVIAGHLQRALVTTYHRADDGATPGFASLGEVSRALVTESSYALVRPGEGDIHKVENPFREPAVTVHLYGTDGAPQNHYDIKAKSLIAVDSPATTGV